VNSIRTIEELSPSIASGIACALSQTVVDGVLHLRPFSVTDDCRLVTSSAPRIPAAAIPSNKMGFQKGDILFNNTNSIELVGKSAIFSSPFEASFSNHMTRIRIDLSQAEPGYVHAYLRHLFNRRFFQDRATRWVGQAAFGTAQLKALEVPLPPLDEQQRIVRLLDRAAQITRRANAAHGKTRAVIAALFHNTFGDAATNPRGWPTVPLGNVIIRITGGKNIEAGTGSSKYRIMKVSAVTSGTFKPDEAKPAPDDHVPAPEHQVRSGDFLFSRANTSELVGAVAIAGEPPDGLLLPDKIWRIEWDTKRFDARYAYSLLQTSEIRRVFSLIGSGTSGSMKNISQAKLRRVSVPLPPLTLQMAFAEQVQRLEALARNLDAAAAKAQAMAASLSAEVFDQAPQNGGDHVDAQVAPVYAL
jgi:type I restriction enzyme S subunit